MKKLLFGAICVFTIAGAYCSDDVADAKGKLEGFYVGGGISQASMDGKMFDQESTYTWADANGMALLGAGLDQAVIISHIGSGMVTIAYGGVNVVSFTAKTSHARHLADGKSSKLGGSLVAGYGKFVDGNLYAGADFTIDVSGKGSKKFNDNGVNQLGDVGFKQGGVCPTVAAKLGVYIPSLESMVYARLGGAWVSAKATTSRGNVKLSKLTGVIGAGVAKSIDCVNVCCEFDYRLRSANEGNLSNIVDWQLPNGVTFSAFNGVNVNTKTKVRTGGYVVRVMATYNLKNS